MAISFSNKVTSGLGTSSTLLLSTSASQTMTIMGLSITNVTDNIIQVSVSVTDASSNTAYYLRNCIVAPNSSVRVVNGGERLVLTPSNSLYAISNVAESADVIVSYAIQV
jgi:hypothetical protein